MKPTSGQHLEKSRQVVLTFDIDDRTYRELQREARIEQFGNVEEYLGSVVMNLIIDAKMEGFRKRR